MSILAHQPPPIHTSSAHYSADPFPPSGSVSAHAELPPSSKDSLLPAGLGRPSLVPFPVFQHRHSSPYPAAAHSFSALGVPDDSPPPRSNKMSTVSLSATVPPPAPKAQIASLPPMTPDAIDGSARTSLPPTPMEMTPTAARVLAPARMVKLAPPADDRPFSEPSSKDQTPRRLPVIAIDTSPDPLPGPTTSSSSNLLPFEPAPIERKPRPKSMGPPARPMKRSQTAIPSSSSTRTLDSRGADSRTRLRAGTTLVHRPASSIYPSNNNTSPGLSRTLTDSAATPPRSRDMTAAPPAQEPDLGGPDGLEAKVVLLGSQGVGKTSLILRCTTGKFSATLAQATIGSSLHTRKLVHGGTRVKLQIWDTAGQERFRSMAPIYYRGAHVCVLVYDISERGSFEDVRSWLEELRKTVPKETVIFVVGAKVDLKAKRAVTLEEARRCIRLWLRPPPPPAPTPASTITADYLSPTPNKSLFRSSSATSRIAASSKAESFSVPSPTPTRSNSHGALNSLVPSSSTRASPPLRASTPGGSVPFPQTQPIKPSVPASEVAQNPKPKREKRVSIRIQTAPSLQITPTSPIISPSAKRLSFPSLQSPTAPTAATTSEHVRPSLTPASPGHRTSAGRFSFSGVLGYSRTTSLSGAASNLHRLAEEFPTSPRSNSSAGLSTRSPLEATRTRIESSPMLGKWDGLGTPSTGLGMNGGRRKSEEWTAQGRGWRMGEGPGAAEQLGEFGEGVKRRESGEMLNKSTPSSGQIRNAGGARARGGSLGRDERLYNPGGSGGVKTGMSDRGRSAMSDRGRGGGSGEDDEGEEGWGVVVDGVRIGEVSALTGEGVENLFRTISSLLVERKDKIERERQLRHKNSVMLTEPRKDASGGDESGSKRGYGCCA